MREETILFESYDLSASGDVRPSAILRRLQEIAGRDLDSYGISYADLRSRNMAFVVSKIALVFEKPLKEMTPYKIRTSAQETHGATFPRSFVIEDAEGVVARANSLWALLDFEKRCLLRASALGDDLPSYPPPLGKRPWFPGTQAGPLPALRILHSSASRAGLHMAASLRSHRIPALYTGGRSAGHLLLSLSCICHMCK